MYAGLLENCQSIKNVADALAACKKIMPTSRVETPDVSLQKEIERLALSAPHVLSDIGFERDAKASSCDKEIWRRGAHCVVILSSKITAVFV